MDIKREKRNETDETVEIIHLDIEGDNRLDDNKIKAETPKTAKDLFSDFKPDSASDFDPNDEEDDSEEDDDQPLSKRIKKEHIRGRKRESKSNGTPNSKRQYLQKYKKEWEDIPSVKPWLSESVHGETYFYCKFCKKDYKCGKSEVFKHMSSMKHKRNTTHPPSEKVIKKQMMKFRGLLCPVVTPFVKSRAKDVCYDLIKPYIKFLKACGVKGVLVNDVLGEGMSLTISERKRVLEYWVNLCKECGIFVMVQIGGAPLRSVIELALHAEKTGVGAIVLLPDLYHRPKDHLDLIRYIKTVSHSTGSMPILYHHYPKFTALDMDMKKFLLDITGEVDTFVGLIYSTGDLQDTVSVMELNPEKFVVFMGTDEGMLGAVASGFTCVMGNSLNILPKLAESICSCMKNGEIKSAQASQSLLTKAITNIYNYGEMVPALKAAMSIVTKLPMDTVRDPMQGIWEGTLIKMREKLREIGII
ncbi:N-acetylneuraminate lyase isoform X2 [Cylas formicarius]|uniref:N-acetylneuraminate lyase isoform X1 n=1 Tax=Cylas formicarius TaxID=197179 RepID=UPI0029589846|nr:N-acetylneuraminate lyase isoform X1 [Cylas formicarius]XP_060526616.1 N-acetylneuraminate lyase isoform X2 [Cylas formicarius]